LQQLEGLNKDKFETSSEFNDRKCDLLYKKLGNQRDTPLIFPINLARVSDLFSYDADKELFYIDPSTIYYGEGVAWLKGGHPTSTDFELFKQSQDSQGYIASNKFGVNSNVEVKSIQHLTLQIISKRFPLNMKFEYPRSRAKQLKDDLTIAIKTKLASPCYTYRNGRSLPKLDTPLDLTINIYNLHASKDAEWILYRKSNGEILKKVRFSE